MDIKTILIVDDDEDLVEVITTYFESENFSVLKAYTGEEGERIAIQEKPDLIILDIMLPRKDGFQICQNLKRNKKTKEIPIIVLSAKTNVSDIEKGFQSLADDYITKPFELKWLLEKVKKMLNI